MEGRSHVLSGWVTGALVGSVLPIAPGHAVLGATGGVLAFAAVAAGAAAFNDLDHDDAAASRVLGPVSRLLAETVQLYARGIYRLTRGPGDPVKRGAHRGATHAVPLLVAPCAAIAALPWVASGVAGSVAEVAGWDVAAARLWAGPVAVAAVIAFALLLVADRLGSRFLAAVGVLGVVGGGTVMAGDPAGALVAVAPWVALAVLVGTATHVVGDAVTECGGPWLAPLYTRDGARWVRIALPKWVAFRTGARFERLFVFPALALAAVAVTPVVGPTVLDIALPRLVDMGHDAIQAF